MKLLFSIFSSLCLVCGTMVIRCRNPVHSVLFLILAFISASALLVLADLQFFAMVYLVVYVGAIAVLFLFVVMMLNIRIAVSESLLPYFPVGALIALIFLFQVFFILHNQFLPQMELYTAFGYTPSEYTASVFFLGLSQLFQDSIAYCWQSIKHNEKIIIPFLQFFQGFENLQNLYSNTAALPYIQMQTEFLSYVYWLDESRPISNIEALGEVLYTYYFVFFLLASLILLIAMVGGITLTMHKGAQVQKQEIAEQNRRDASKTVAKIRSY